MASWHASTAFGLHLFSTEERWMLLKAMESLLMSEGMHSMSIACLLMYPLSVGFCSNILNSLLVYGMSLADSLRFALQFNDISKDLGYFDPCVMSYSVNS